MLLGTLLAFWLFVPLPGGPMQAMGWASWFDDEQFEQGQVFTDGQPILHFEGIDGRTVVIEQVRPVDPRGVTYLGAMLAGGQRSTGAQFPMDGFPPEPYPGERLGPLQTAEGARLVPPATVGSHQGWELLLGYEITESTAAVRGVEVVYRVGPIRYRQVHELEFEICTTDAVSCPDQND